MKRFLLACAIVLVGLTACDPNGGKKVDWFGNPLPTEPTGSCKINRPPGPPAVRNPPVKANWGIQIEVNAIRFNRVGDQVCRDVPVDFEFHLFGTADGLPGLYANTEMPLPVNGNAVTPWKTDVFVDLKAKKWEIDLIAKAGPTRASEPDVTLFCNMYIYQGKDIIASSSAKLERATNTVRCRVKYPFS